MGSLLLIAQSFVQLWSESIAFAIPKGAASDHRIKKRIVRALCGNCGGNFLFSVTQISQSAFACNSWLDVASHLRVERRRRTLAVSNLADTPIRLRRTVNRERSTVNAEDEDDYD
jgi:transcription elongation factor Elf1